MTYAGFMRHCYTTVGSSVWQQGALVHASRYNHVVCPHSVPGIVTRGALLPRCLGLQVKLILTLS